MDLGKLDGRVSEGEVDGRDAEGRKDHLEAPIRPVNFQFMLYH